MSKTVVQEGNPADPIVDAYRTVLEAAAAAQRDEPAWLRERRKAARTLFETHGVPSARLEAFRQTDLGAIRSQVWPVAAAPGQVTEDDLAPHRIAGAAAEIVLIDGRPAPAFSTSAADGIDVRTLGDAWRDEPDLLEPHLARIVAHDGPEQTLRALNTTLFSDGVVVRFPKHSVHKAPVHILHVATGQDGKHSAHPRVLVQVGEAAEAVLVETYVGLGADTWTNAVTELVLDPAAILDHIKIQDEPLGAHHALALGADIGRGAKLRDLSVAIGAGVSRTDITTCLSEGAEVHLDGLFLGRASQLVDHHTWIDHAAPHGTSIERYKGILDGKSHGVFTGNILVRPGAQKTNSDQQNRNLILSREALVDTTPQLEIHADDVKCAHGSTIGRLPPQQLFYLRSRGFTEEEAKRVLTEAFAAEVLDQVPEGPIRDRLDSLLAAWFRVRQEVA